MNSKSARERKNPDLRTPQEKAEWEEIRAGSVEMQSRARLPEAPKPFDLWNYDTAHLLDELAGIREMILRVPITLQTRIGPPKAPLTASGVSKKTFDSCLASNATCKPHSPEKPLNSKARLKTTLQSESADLHIHEIRA